MADYTKYTKQEMQAYAIAKSIKENQIVIVGTGLPLIGASLAKRAVCPSCHPIVESGLMDCSPVEVPRSVGDNRFMAHCAVIHFGTSINKIFRTALNKSPYISVGLYSRKLTCICNSFNVQMTYKIACEFNNASELL